MKLRQLCMEDAEGMLEWMHDPDINSCFRFDASSYDLEKVQSFIKKASESYQQGLEYHFAVTEAGQEYLGTISLKAVDLVNRNAEYAICLRKSAMGKGLAYEATMKLLEFAFDKLDLNKVYLNVLSNNRNAIRLYERCGFKYEGEWKNHLYLRGQFCSLKWYGVQKEEWLINGKNNA